MRDPRQHGVIADLIVDNKYSYLYGGGVRGGMGNRNDRRRTVVEMIAEAERVDTGRLRPPAEFGELAGVVEAPNERQAGGPETETEVGLGHCRQLGGGFQCRVTPGSWGPTCWRNALARPRR